MRKIKIVINSSKEIGLEINDADYKELGNAKEIRLESDRGYKDVVFKRSEINENQPEAIQPIKI